MSDAEGQGLHPSLARQLRRLGLEPDVVPDEAGWGRLLETVARTYAAADADRALLERSMEISSAEMIELNDALRHQARHDALTGLPNRADLRDTLRELLAEPSQGPCTVLFVDLDGFKLVNDTLGHEAGDEVLVQTARRLRAAVRDEDVLARLGGDEFVVVCPNTSTAEGVALGHRLVQALEETVVTGGVPVVVGASIGVSGVSGVSGASGASGVEHVADGPPPDADGLLRDADLAMYESKRLGKAQVRVFDESIRHRVGHRVSTEQGLRLAVAAGELLLHYQPLVDLRSGRVVGFEALVRWDRPGHGLVPPDDFLPVAAQSGLVTGIDRWVVAQACADAAGWPDPTLTVSVNLVAADLREAQTVRAVQDALRTTGLSPDRLVLELTEGTAVGGDDEVARNLEALRRLGVAISIDDFGTGYSALSYLGRLAASSLKIDRTFTQRLGRDDAGAAMVRAMVSMAEAFGIAVVAEGVETPEQAELVRHLGCDSAQGFHFARPMPAGRVASYLAGGRQHGRALAG